MNAQQKNRKVIGWKALNNLQSTTEDISFTLMPEGEWSEWAEYPSGIVLHTLPYFTPGATKLYVAQGEGVIKYGRKDDTGDTPLLVRRARVREVDVEKLVRLIIRGKSGNLAGINLAARDLGGANLIGRDLTGANLVAAYLGNANLAFVIMPWADLRGINGHNLRAESAILNGSILDESYLACANLSKSIAHRMSIKNAYLRGADLRGISWREVNASSCSFLSANLTNAQITESFLYGADFTSVLATGLIMSDSTARYSEIIDARMDDAVMLGADLRGSRIIGARLSNVCAMGANFQGVIIEKCNISGDWRRVSFAGAKLDDVVFNGALLSGANFFDAAMSKVTFKDCEMRGAFIDPRSEKIRDIDVMGGNIYSCWEGKNLVEKGRMRLMDVTEFECD